MEVDTYWLSTELIEDILFYAWNFKTHYSLVVTASLFNKVVHTRGFLSRFKSLTGIRRVPSVAIFELSLGIDIDAAVPTIPKPRLRCDIPLTNATALAILSKAASNPTYTEFATQRWGGKYSWSHLIGRKYVTWFFLGLSEAFWTNTAIEIRADCPLSLLPRVLDTILLLPRIPTDTVTLISNKNDKLVKNLCALYFSCSEPRDRKLVVETIQTCTCYEIEGNEQLSGVIKDLCNQPLQKRYDTVEWVRHTLGFVSRTPIPVNTLEKLGYQNIPLRVAKKRHIPIPLNVAIIQCKNIAQLTHTLVEVTTLGNEDMYIHISHAFDTIERHPARSTSKASYKAFYKAYLELLIIAKEDDVTYLRVTRIFDQANDIALDSTFIERVILSSRYMSTYSPSVISYILANYPQASGLSPEWIKELGRIHFIRFFSAFH